MIVSSIGRHVGGLRVQLEPPLNVSLKAELGAERALGVDISNACAGMMTGVFILNDLIRQGRIRRGMVVSAEYISELGRNAAQEVRTVMDDQLASRTLGDAGAAVILERAPQGAAGIEVAGFTTLSEHSRLCVAFPAKIGPGVTMHTQAREIHRVATEEAVPMLQEVQCYTSGRVEEAVRYCDADMSVFESGRGEVPFGIESFLCSAYMYAGQPERSAEWNRSRVQSSSDTHTLSRVGLIISLVSGLRTHAGGSSP